MTAKGLAILGTGSDVGKSTVVAGLCRVLSDAGVAVAPFKAQNMALNSSVTPDGLEIGRAQAVQAAAAGIEPSVEMNPILLKPEHGMRSQVVVMGKPLGTMPWAEYSAMRPRFTAIVAECLAKLRRSYDLVLIEGAGNPAEINLKSNDIVNMHVARLADAPVLMVGDIDRGGVFAQLVGTMELLAHDERSRVAGFLINKFRGNADLLRPGTDFLESRFGIPVLGVIPFIERLRVADEDSVALDERPAQSAGARAPVRIAVVRVPHISNFDDFLALEHEAGVELVFVERPDALSTADLAIIPGSKVTVSDLAWMRAQGFADAFMARARAGGPILGICGGCQMLGERIEDPLGVESGAAETKALGLLPLVARFERDKVTTRVRATANTISFLTDNRRLDDEISGYEIHMGRTALTRAGRSAFRIIARNGASCDVADGAVGGDGTVVGTMLHGIFDNAHLRRAMLARLGGSRWVDASDGSEGHEPEYERLSAIVRENLDFESLRRIARL